MLTLTKSVLYFLLFCGIFWILIRILENKLVFFPTKYPQSFDLLTHYNLQPQTHFITAGTTKIHAWYFQVQNPQATIFFLHGNAGNVADRIPFFHLLQQKIHVNIFAIDYRGYGKSSGTPTEKGVYKDAEYAWRYLVEELHLHPEDVIIWGRSLGGAVAVDLAAKENAAGLILESTFSSGKDMAKRMFGFLPIWIFSGIQFDSANKITSITYPKLFLHGDADNIVPFELGRKLYDCAAQPKEFIKIAGAEHNDTYIVGGSSYWHIIHSFISETVNQKQE
ncbi:MAG: alpha/beta hydrolase [Deferribacteres bacterium]|nr:alpha/beta hydrolase [candidate division KSB1 bacterium]MCB9502367.1 alpha/beta hydrolase [Deferribacteres bacterium]